MKNFLSNVTEQKKENMAWNYMGIELPLISKICKKKYGLIWKHIGKETNIKRT